MVVVWVLNILNYHPTEISSLGLNCWWIAFVHLSIYPGSPLCCSKLYNGIVHHPPSLSQIVKRIFTGEGRGRKVGNWLKKIVYSDEHKKLTTHMDRDWIIIQQSLTCIFQFSHKCIFLTPLFSVLAADVCPDCRGFPPYCSCEDYLICKSQGCDTGECQPDCPGIWCCMTCLINSPCGSNYILWPVFCFHFHYATVCVFKFDLFIVKYF